MELQNKAFNKKKTLTVYAEEIIMAAEKNGESFAIRKKKESESQADLLVNSSDNSRYIFHNQICF